MTDAPLGPLADILGLQVRLAHGAIQRDYAARASDLKLTQKQVSVLWLIHDAPGTAQTDLARRLQMDRATTMTLVHGLERRGLVVRAATAGDARRRGFAITDAGSAALDKARTIIAAHEGWLAARFSPSERGLLRELLTRIYADDNSLS